ncbi:hypothetical protein P5673_018393 [Acropora cervicornis]|uniref:Uncharacterized protein n=1 Tax=Acropora cervicornis TaxID=6130 RepID=A0AAD9V3D7_ACRCE|nr:hypothetical protein P5673_018393 [Acropora cervicornis]
MASQEGCLDGAPTQQDTTTSPVESILKELTELRKANQKLNDRLRCVLQRSTAKKSLFGSKCRSSVDPSCSKLSHRLEMFDKADLPAQDKEKARASLNMDNARDSLSSEESDTDGGQRTYPVRFINSVSFTDTDRGQTTFRAH